MTADGLIPYERALATGEDLVAVAPDGAQVHWDVRRWLAPIDDADRTVLARCVGPTLDVGCGPGRFVHARALSGQIALGVDVAATAVELTARRGAAVLMRDVFDRVPGEGRWQSVLLMDGNIGIGGDPTSLLARLAQLLAPSGQLLVEIDPDDAMDQRLVVRLADALSAEAAASGADFDWAVVGGRALLGYAAAAALSYGGSWTADGRVFVCLTRRGLPPR